MPSPAGAARSPDLPRWARSAPSPSQKTPGPSPWLLATGLAIAAALVTWPAMAAHGVLAASHLVALAALAICALLLVHARLTGERALRASEAANQRFSEIYDRAGISIWREDWTPVGRRMLELRQSGVTDIPGYFDARPDEKKALHAAVRITDVNRFTVQLMAAADKAELLGSLADVLPHSYLTFSRWLGALARGDDVYIAESKVRRADGSLVDCLVTAALPQSLESFADIMVSIVEISEYKRDQARLAEAESEVARAQRIATMGALTASIAHEVNSPLAAISSNAAACIRWLVRPEPDLAEAQSAARAVLQNVERAQGVIERTRAFISRSEPRRADIDLPALIRSSLQILDREARSHGCELRLETPGEIAPLRGDPIQLQQVLVNLILNGLQACASRPEKLVRVRTWAEGDQVVTAVSDTGPGIPAEHLGQLFQPFFSTKPTGMGMGLAICRSVIEAHGGEISVSSAPEEGATVVFRLPLSQSSVL
ncbi:sensor histidine kinase [Phenylobacterium deserti]|nr:ATP-binding protein [Phenylobacterium deserti]